MLRTGFDNAGALSLAAMGGRVRSYYEKVMGYGPLVYFPQWEGIGLVSQELIHGWDGAYQGITWNPADTGPDGYQVPFYDGANDYNNILTAGLIAAFNGAEGTVALWSQVANVGVWTGALRFILRLRANANNEVYMSVSNPNMLNFVRIGGGVTQTINDGGHTELDFFLAAMTWSESTPPAGEVRAYFNGAQVGLTQVGLGAWAANLTTAVIGASSVVPANPWHGWLAHCAIWTRALAPAEIADLAVV